MRAGRPVAVVVAVLAVAGIAGRSGVAGTPAYEVGTAKVSIAPAEFPAPPFAIYVGGVIPGPLRPANGNAKTTYARAVAISTPEDKGVVLAEVDIQGAFAATKQGPYGLDDAARIAAAQIGLDPAQIVIGSSHTHAGADIMGLWGGSPWQFMKFVHDRVVEAVVDAWNERVPANLSWVSTTAPELLLNQSDYQGVDDELRMLVARDAADQVIALLPNWQGHPSIVPGTHLHPDWVGDLDDHLEAAYPDAFAMSFVGAVGHTQTTYGSNTDEATGYAKSAEYAGKLETKLDAAMTAGEHPIAAGDVRVAQVFLREAVVNPVTLALNQMPDRTSTLYRSDSPPWLSDATTDDDLGVRQSRNVVGTRAWAVRIGDVLLAAAPGEAYPWIHWQVRDFAGTTTSKLFFMGLAGDTLGYLAAPSEDIPKFATDVNDNLVVHISPTIGDHVMCSLVKASATVGFGGSAPAPTRCMSFSGDQVPFSN